MTAPDDTTDPGTGLGPTLATALVVAAAALVAGTELHRVFGWGEVVLPALLGTTAGLLPAVAAARWRWPAGASFVPALALLVAVALPVCSPGDLATGVVDGWDQILTSPIPADPEPTMLATVIVLAFVAAWLGGELGLRARRALGVVPAVAAFAVAAVFGAPAGGSRLVPAVVLAVLAGLLLHQDARQDPERITALTPAAVGRAVAAGAVAVTVGVLAGPGLPVVGGHPAADPRPEEPPREEHRVAVNPLALLSGWAQKPGLVLVEAELDREVALRIAVLDRFDGSTWSSSSSLGRAGAVLGPAQGALAGPDTEAVRQVVTVRALDGGWLPSADRPVRYDGDAAWFDEATGTLVARGPDTGEDRTYEVVSQVPVLAQADLETARSDVGSAEEIAIPGLPEGLGDLARSAVVGATTPYGQALALSDWLRRRGSFDAEAPSGHSWTTLQYFLEDEAEAGGRRGTSEQFASAFAALGRAVGLPTRVVVGFPAGAGTGDGQLTTGDARAWPEVHFQGLGWVAFDPTPEPGEDLPDRPEPTTPPTIPTSAPPIDMGGGSAGQDEDERGTSIDAGTADGSGWTAPVLALAAVLVLLALLAAPPVAKARRRRRRQRGDDRHQVLGAWADVADALVDLGTTAPMNRSRSDIVAATSSRVGGSAGALAQLGDLANLAGFDPAEPAAGSGPRAWTLATEVRTGLRRATGPLPRLRAALSLRSLRRGGDAGGSRRPRPRGGSRR